MYEFITCFIIALTVNHDSRCMNDINVSHLEIINSAIKDIGGFVHTISHNPTQLGILFQGVIHAILFDILLMMFFMRTERTRFVWFFMAMTIITIRTQLYACIIHIILFLIHYYDENHLNIVRAPA